MALVTATKAPTTTAEDTLKAKTGDANVISPAASPADDTPNIELAVSANAIAHAAVIAARAMKIRTIVAVSDSVGGWW